MNPKSEIANFGYIGIFLCFFIMFYGRFTYNVSYYFFGLFSLILISILTYLIKYKHI